MLKTAEWYPAGSTFADLPLVLHDATKVPFRVLREVKGLEAPSWSFQSFATPGVDGVRFGDVTATRSEVEIPVFLYVPSRSMLRALKSELVVSMAPTAGVGRLVLSEDVGLESGARRYCEAIYRGGLEGNGADTGYNWWRFVLRFECTDPYWYTPEASVASWRGRQSAANSFVADRWDAASWSVAPYGVEVVEPLELDGDTEAWPQFTLSGPWSRVRFTNDATGLWWEKRRDASVSESLVINTKPGSESTRNLAGENRHGFSAGWQFFPVRPAAGNRAADTVSVEVDGADGSTTFEMSVNPAWLTAP